VLIVPKARVKKKNIGEQKVEISKKLKNLVTNSQKLHPTGYFSITSEEPLETSKLAAFPFLYVIYPNTLKKVL
jgi:hypothetical protein